MLPLVQTNAELAKLLSFPPSMLTYLVVLLPSLGSAWKARILALAFDQKARLASAPSIFPKARLMKIFEKRAFQRFTKMNDGKSKICD